MRTDEPTPAPSALLRHSTRMRLALAERNYAVASGASEPEWVAALLLPSIEATELQLYNVIADEARAALVRLKKLMRHEAFPELDPAMLHAVIDRKNLSFHARVSGDAQSGPLIEISVGTLLAIDDTILSAASKGAFFANAGPETIDLDEAIPLFTSREMRPGRFRDYGLPDSAQLRLLALSRSLPRVSWRLMQCDCLVELALHWIVLHEYSHWALGHLGLAGSRAGAHGQAFALDEVRHSFRAEGDGHCLIGLNSDEHKAIELQADFLASELLFFYHRAQEDSPSSALARFARAMPTLVNVRGTVLGSAEEATANRMLTTASGVVVLTMEAQRRAKGCETSDSHPSPEARALQMMSLMFGLANRRHQHQRDDGKQVIRTTDDDVIAEIEAMLRQQFRPFLIDMWAVSEVLVAPPLFLQTQVEVSPSPDPDLANASATLQDFLLLMFERVTAAGQLSTAGAKEFLELKQCDDFLRREALPFAVWLPGDPDVRSETAGEADASRG